MEREKESFISEIENRVHILIAIGIFFPTLAYNFSKLADTSEAIANRTALGWGTLIVLYLAVYGFFEIRKNKMTNRVLVWVNRLTLSEILLFIFPITVFVSAATKISPLAITLFVPSLIALIAVPLVILIIILFSWWYILTL